MHVPPSPGSRSIPKPAAAIIIRKLTGSPSASIAAENIFLVLNATLLSAAAMLPSGRKSGSMKKRFFAEHAELSFPSATISNAILPARIVLLPLTLVAASTSICILKHECGNPGVCMMLKGCHAFLITFVPLRKS